MSTFTTTVEGATLAEIEEAADAELSRFFDGEPVWCPCPGFVAMSPEEWLGWRLTR